MFHHEPGDNPKASELDPFRNQPSLSWTTFLQATDPGRLDDGSATGRQNMLQLIQLRWIAVLGQVMTILVAQFLLGLELPLNAMLALVLLLVLFNVGSMLFLRAGNPVSNTQLFIALLADVGILTAQLHFSGGASNPFIFLYLLQITLAAVLLTPRSTWIMVGITSVCFAWLALSKQTLILQPAHEQGLNSLYVLGMLVCFALNAALIVVFMTRISRNLRMRDTHLAAMRQAAAEEEHIVHMGLLASGAAHELGTPLSTMAVILGDWQHMLPFTKNPELLQEIDEMQTQVMRCKAIVTGILVSAGKTRGDSPTETTVHQFLDQVVAQWRTLRQPRQMLYENHFGPDVRIVSDSALQQMIGNVLDNALEASPNWLRVEVTREEDILILTVMDAGPGFAAEMLAHLGEPYNSNKGKPGGGLGLFLSVNVARTLGGSITAQNLLSGGASVKLSLPLSAIKLEKGDEH